MSEDKGNISDGYHTFNELYEHRYMLFIALCNARPAAAWKSLLHDDNTMFDACFIAGIYNNKGEVITYHLPIRLWNNLDVQELDRAPKWDGHTSSDVLKRLEHF